jgi:Phospholipid methyltransferase
MYIVATFVGLALAVISFALVVLARLQLGKSFSVAPKATDLVERGLYSRLRHPMYLFVDLSVCGIALAVHRGYVLLPLVIFLPLQMRNARTERKILQEKFGERYEALLTAIRERGLQLIRMQRLQPLRGHRFLPTRMFAFILLTMTRLRRNEVRGRPACDKLKFMWSFRHASCCWI